MKFASVVENIAKSTDLKRIAKAHIVDITRLHDDEVRAHLLNADKHYANTEVIKERVTVEALMVIVPAFTDSAKSDARARKIRSGNVILLITADELRKIAFDWSESKKANDAFPLNYFSAAGRYDPQFLVDLV